MPARDKTGPMGLGPATGRRMGPCVAGPGYGFGFGQGRGWGRGMGRNWFGCRFFGGPAAYDGYGWERSFFTAEEEKEELQAYKEQLEQELQAVQQELDQMA